jgi:hypothetical protein
MIDIDQLGKAMHDERAEKDTRKVDCWACEAIQSDAVTAILARLREAEAAASHMHAVLIRAVPDEDEQAALWRDHWRDQLDKMREDA